ncbi:hypothetical protein B0H14DRAFT_2632147 [Mycena olivaceomarginata]|nr:hypothetical protein B0H14DRAFT_2632147 [Mycena olivaceomarginata]
MAFIVFARQRKQWSTSQMAITSPVKSTLATGKVGSKETPSCRQKFNTIKNRMQRICDAIAIMLCMRFASLAERTCMIVREKKKWMLKLYTLELKSHWIIALLAWLTLKPWDGTEYRGDPDVTTFCKTSGDVNKTGKSEGNGDTGPLSVGPEVEAFAERLLGNDCENYDEAVCTCTEIDDEVTKMDDEAICACAEEMDDKVVWTCAE